jgi:signal transduction histidine kinase
MLARLRADQVRLHATTAELAAAKDELARTRGELEQRAAIGARGTGDRALESELAQRSQLEVELRQAQKLESVGRLASGIAHEINTPVQFVSDSCTFLDTATADLIALIAAYRSALAELDRGTTIEAAARVRELETERDLVYLIEQIPLAIHRALGGLERVSAIVRAMKEFAYPDHAEQVPADLNRAILSTLTVARNEYKYVAEVRTELDDLPLVTCHIGELNQVILNMVVNSAHAIAEAGTKADGSRDGLIMIRTRASDDLVEIEIEDNGCGIPASEFDKIFDPFFTTKEIGKGSGQGLAIARAVIVEKHAGKIDVASRVGHGTTFTITLPVFGRDQPGPGPIAGKSPARSDDSIDRGPRPSTGLPRESA